MKETATQKKRRLEKKRQYYRLKLSKETAEVKSKRLKVERQRMSQVRAKETFDQREYRLAKDRERKSRARAAKGKKQHSKERLDKDQEGTSQAHITETKEKEAYGLTKEREGTSQVRLNETKQKLMDIQQCRRDARAQHAALAKEFHNFFCIRSYGMKQRLALWKLKVAKNHWPLIPPATCSNHNAPSSSSSSSTACCTAVSTIPTSSMMPSTCNARSQCASDTKEFHKIINNFCDRTSDMKQRLALWKLQVAMNCRPLIPPIPALHPHSSSSSSSSTECRTTVSSVPTSSTMPLPSTCEMRHLSGRSKWNHTFSVINSEFPLVVGGVASGGGGSNVSSSSPSSSSSLALGTPRGHPQGANTILEMGLHGMGTRCRPWKTREQFTASSVFLSKRPSLQELLLAETSLSHTTLPRPKSAPPELNYNFAGVAGDGNKATEESGVGFALPTTLGGSPAGHKAPSVAPTDPEYFSCLEYLCLSMT